jgi:hypothetical protein
LVLADLALQLSDSFGEGGEEAVDVGGELWGEMGAIQFGLHGKSLESILVDLHKRYIMGSK